MNSSWNIVRSSSTNNPPPPEVIGYRTAHPDLVIEIVAIAAVAD
jgi:hypothetical protein